jgi:hypothetical protein
LHGQFTDSHKNVSLFQTLAKDHLITNQPFSLNASIIQSFAAERRIASSDSPSMWLGFHYFPSGNVFALSNGDPVVHRLPKDVQAVRREKENYVELVPVGHSIGGTDY